MGFGKGKTLRLRIKKCLSCQTSLALSFIDYEQAFDSVDRKALAKILSLYGIPDKYIKVINPGVILFILVWYPPLYGSF